MTLCETKLCVQFIWNTFFHHLDTWINLSGVDWAEFAFYNNMVDYHTAKQLCTTIGGILYEPKNQSVMQIVINQTQKANIGEFWIGIHDMDNEGTFVYDSDNSPISFTNWNFGEPNNAGLGEDCAIMNGHGKWNGLPCTDSQRSTVCFREKGICISI